MFGRVRLDHSPFARKLLHMNPTTRTLFAASFTLAFGFFAGGVALGVLLHLAACPLCIIQRMLYLSFAFAALLGLVFRGSSAGRGSAKALMLLSAGTGTFVAGYQTWLQHFPTGIGCAANSPWWEEFVYWAGEKLPQLFQAGGMCEDSSWKLFGLSIAEYSLVAFSGLTVLAVYALVRRYKA